MSRLRSLLSRILRLCLAGAIGVLLTLIIVYVVFLDDRADLGVWHLADLDQEFTEHSPVSSFTDYLALEDRLFAQLDERVYALTGPGGDDDIDRYRRGSLSDPQRWSPNWNHSYEMPAASPDAAVLLLHGMSDSPYSLRKMAETLHTTGAYVLGLRVPGHGTAPSGLVTVTWQDMAAAVRLAIRHLAEQNGGRPVYIVGYSNGAALAVHYALATLDDPALPPVDGLVLISPEIGLTPVAALAIWQARLGRLLGLDKLAWNSILPEYDPFKYGSFAVNAGDVSYRITQEIQRRITLLTENDQLDGLPPILAFSSVVDATVVAPDLVKHLFNRLPPGGHKLVLFDINRRAEIKPLIKWRPDTMVKALREDPDRVFELSLVTNRDVHSSNMIARTWVAGLDKGTDQDLGLQWPIDVYSLAHVALPFPPNDPVYGDDPDHRSPGIRLGNIAFRGERGVLEISASDLLRLRWNPFYPYLEASTLEFLGLN